MKIFLLLIAIIWFSSAKSKEETRDGYSFVEKPNQYIRIDVYEDLLCSDSVAFHFPFMKFLRGRTAFGDLVTDHVHAVFHIFPLPFHHNSFFVTQLIPFVYDLRKESEDVLLYSEYILKNQRDYLSKTTDSTEKEVMQKICHKSSSNLQLFSYNQCMSAFDDRNYIIDTVKQWKKGAHEGISGTPTVFINGLEVDPPQTVQEWHNLISPILPQYTEQTGIRGEIKGNEYYYKN